MELDLPEDVLYLVCDHVRRLPESAAGTLFNMAVSSKRIAPLALACIYRHARSPEAFDETEASSMAEIGQLVMKWAIMWHSIFAATTGKTLYPYHSYLRFLDLRDLGYLIENDRFRGKVEKFFFQGELAPLKSRSSSLRTLEHFGDAIVSRNTMIEGISGSFGNEALQRWLPNLPRLTHFELWDGSVLADESTQRQIIQLCVNFRDLHIFTWFGPPTGRDGDAFLGPFIAGLPEQSLNSLVCFSSCGASTETTLALNRHDERLRRIHLILEPAAAPALGVLEPCISLEKLHIEFSSSVDMAQTNPDAAASFSSWLEGCKKLKDVTLMNMASAPAALTPLLLDEAVQLESLSLTAWNMPLFRESNEVFFHALAHQKSLRELDLRADGEDSNREQISNFINSLSRLKNLKLLELRQVMDNFEDEHIIALLSGLSQLETVYIGGYYATDMILDAIGSMKRLKRINIAGISNFSTSGLLDMVQNLDSVGNDGIFISVDSADPDHLLSLEEQDIIRQSLRETVNGTFEYIPLREPDDSDSENYSD